MLKLSQSCFIIKKNHFCHQHDRVHRVQFTIYSPSLISLLTHNGLPREDYMDATYPRLQPLIRVEIYVICVTLKSHSFSIINRMEEVSFLLEPYINVTEENVFSYVSLCCCSKQGTGEQFWVATKLVL